MALSRAEIESRRERQAASIVNGAEMVSGFRIMDPESEEILSSVLEQYDGNDRNHVSLSRESLKESLAQHVLLHCEKLKHYGAFSGYFPYGGEVIEIYLSERGKTYFGRKEEAVERDRVEREGRKRLESDLLRIHSMTLEELQGVYTQALLTNQTLNDSLELQKAQLEALRNLFVSGEDGVAVQKEIMRLVEENESLQVRDFLADKGADLVVAGIIEAVKVYLIAHGVTLG